MKIKCSNCGSQFELLTHTDFVVCEFCSSTLYLKFSSALKYYYFIPMITDNRADSILYESLKRIGVPNLKVFSKEKI
ncbi:MAG: hypothetical protein N2445_00750 [Acidobacteria bacterium]|nr:hypothetical protein [Acidobacteriota bacterium]